MTENKLFEEVQRVSKTPVMLIPLGMVAASLVYFVQSIGRPEPEASQLLTMTLAFALVFSIGLLVLYTRFVMCTTLLHDRLVLQYKPFNERPIHIADIKAVEATDYDPLKKLGWGCKGNSWTVSGRDAIQITLRSGDTLIIGTTQQDELLKALRSVTGRG